MAKEDISLREEMGRLEIEPVKLSRNRNDENPFDYNLQQRKNIFKRPFIQNNCSCSLQRRNKNLSIVKKKQNGILKEPVLKIIKKCSKSNVIERTECQQLLCKNVLQSKCFNNNNLDTLNLCTLVQNCNQLKISSGSNKPNLQVSDYNKWWKHDMSNTKQVTESRQSSQAGTCSQQALNPPCDVTIDELASYFETLVHIPKKMSSMAEMMYI